MSPVEMAMLGVNTPENEAALREFEERKFSSRCRKLLGSPVYWTIQATDRNGFIELLSVGAMELAGEA